jgi:hypothetical protein
VARDSQFDLCMSETKCDGLDRPGLSVTAATPTPCNPTRPAGLMPFLAPCSGEQFRRGSSQMTICQPVELDRPSGPFYARFEARISPMRRVSQASELHQKPRLRAKRSSS